MRREDVIIASLPREGWISAHALARILGCSLQAVKRFAQQNDIERIVIGGKWLLNLAELEKIHKTTKKGVMKYGKTKG